jgi:hypothetical protein
MAWADVALAKPKTAAINLIISLLQYADPVRRPPLGEGSGCKTSATTLAL